MTRDAVDASARWTGMKEKGYSFGTFQGVFTPNILTIIGVVMYLRFSWVLGSVGLVATLAIVTLSSTITLLTGLSISALSTNMRVGAGGAYYMISRSLGIEVGAAVGIPLFLSQTIGTAFYIAGFAEAFTHSVPFAAGWDPRIVGLVALVLLTALATFSADLALKSQYFIMGAIVLSLVSFFCGGPPDLPSPEAAAAAGHADSPGFWLVLAVFFPAVTGILSGLSMSGDLKEPSKSLPLGTVSAVLVGWAIYMAVPIAMNHFVPDGGAILTSEETAPIVMQRCARIQWLVVLGVWCASLSSALGSILGAPRTLQTLAKDGAMPRFLARGLGAENNPVAAAVLAFAIACGFVWMGEINQIATILTIINLTVYALLNLSSGLEDFLGSPSWRPSFRVHFVFSFAGAVLCIGMMFMISPGAVFGAAAIVGLVWWWMTRRSLYKSWGDMRMGLLQMAVHRSLRALRSLSMSAHSWRPNLLVFVGALENRPRLVEFAAALSGRHDLATFATHVTADWTPSRIVELGESMRKQLKRRDIHAQVKVLSGPSLWKNLDELIRVYGYGQLEPNTILMGDCDNLEALAGTVGTAIASRKNVIVLRSDEGELFPSSSKRRIDVWWRGRSSNASFMLALAFLLSRAAKQKAGIRLCHLPGAGESAAESRKLLESFMASSRVDGEIVVPDMDGESPFSRIAEVSAEAQVALFGLRPPREGESAADYATYLGEVREATASLPQAVFVLGAETLDFKSIFSDGGSQSASRKDS